MRVELSVNLRHGKPVLEAKKKPVINLEAKAEKWRRDREDRWLQRLALAHVVAHAIDCGEFTDMAAVARRCGVSRARISNLVSSMRKFPPIDAPAPLAQFPRTMSR